MFKNERFDFFLLANPNLKSFSKCIFLCGMGIIDYRLGCFTLIVYMMMSPLGTSL